MKHVQLIRWGISSEITVSDDFQNSNINATYNKCVMIIYVPITTRQFPGPFNISGQFPEPLNIPGQFPEPLNISGNPIMGGGMSQSFSNLNLGSGGNGDSAANLSQSANAINFPPAFNQPNILVSIFYSVLGYI